MARFAAKRKAGRTMDDKLFQAIAAEMNLKPQQVLATIILLNGEATVPFIARYRKELTGNLDEVQIAAIRDRAEQLHELEKRKQAVLKSLKEQNKLTPALEKAVLAAETLTKVEDIYLPFKPKKITRAGAAKEKGLEPLADILFRQEDGDAFALARPFVNPEKNAGTVQIALSGARDILAERISEDAAARGRLRELYLKKGIVSCRVVKNKEKEEDAQKFRDYFNWDEPASKIPSHRFLAIRRGRDEGFLTAKITGVQEPALDLLRATFVKKANPCGAHVWLACQDAYARLLDLSLQVDTMVELKKRSDRQAIQVFAENLRELLLASPLGQKNVMGIDPGYRTGCKVVCLDAQGKLLADTVIYPTKSDLDKFDAGKQINFLCNKYDIEAIAIGNGTASRETEAFVRSLGLEAQVAVVNEAGASVYSASDVAREEFPDKDITVRGAVSIGRRLMDPLAELVKIDPKSIGVGQYQHDVDQYALKKSLDDVVISCVNAVGVDVNTASKEILTYVSGLGPRLAQNIVDYRNKNGRFPSREKLKEVPMLGARAFEQAAGFLRIRGSTNCLDASAVHPERYPLVESMARDLGCAVEDLLKDKALREKIDVQKYVSAEVGLPTLEDILRELDKPGRDPRQKFEAFAFAEGVHELSDLKEGMVLPGIVTNVAAFGAFVDVGVHQDGLVHISELSDDFVRDPMDVVRVSQPVKVTVIGLDLDRRRIALSMKSKPEVGKARFDERKSGADFKVTLADLASMEKTT
jgi:protein Tex